MQRAWQLFRSLVERKIVEFIPKTEDGAYLRVNVELQEDFSMDQVLSLYLLETIPLMDPQAPDYALVSAHAGGIHPRRPGDHPAQATRQGEGPEDGGDEDGGDRIRRAHGGTGEARISQAEPRIYLFHVQRLRRPASVGGPGKHPAQIHCARNVRGVPLVLPITSRITNCSAPKGVLLRHLNSVFKVLAQTVPDAAKNDTVREMELVSGHDDPAGGFQPAG